MKFREVTRLPEFERDFKRLLKKFRTLEEDLATFVDTQLVLYHKRTIDNGGVFRIDDLGRTVVPIFKAKKFACRSLKGKGVRSGIRVIYAYDEDRDRVKLVEIYFKSDKEIEDRERIRRRFGENP
jgi:mRNA-degrading endonuclease RelE of RelBE toxin-antitoxin system